MSRAKLSGLALGAFALALVGCGGQKAEQPDQTAPAATGATAQVAADTTPTAVLWNDGKSKPLDIQVAHPSGVVLQLTSLQSRPTETGIGVRVINGRDEDSTLNYWVTTREGYILLENGERLYLSPPTTNPKLNVPAGKTFEGELVFLGRLPRLQSAVLVLNDGNNTDSTYTDTPGFRIDLPLAAAAPAAAVPAAAAGAGQ